MFKPQLLCIGYILPCVPFCGVSRPRGLSSCAVRETCWLLCRSCHLSSISGRLSGIRVLGNEAAGAYWDSFLAIFLVNVGLSKPSEAVWSPGLLLQGVSRTYLASCLFDCRVPCHRKHLEVASSRTSHPTPGISHSCSWESQQWGSFPSAGYIPSSAHSFVQQARKLSVMLADCSEGGYC